MNQFLDSFAQLLQAVITRNEARICEALLEYGRHNCQLVLVTLAER